MSERPLPAGLVQGIFGRGVKSSDERAKIWLAGYNECYKSSEESTSPSGRGLAYSDEWFIVVAYFGVSRLLYLAFPANLGLLCMPHPGMEPLV